MSTTKIADLSAEQIEHVVARAAQRTGEDLGYVRRALKVMQAIGGEVMRLDHFDSLRDEASPS